VLYNYPSTYAIIFVKVAFVMFIFSLNLHVLESFVGRGNCLEAIVPVMLWSQLMMCLLYGQQSSRIRYFPICVCNEYE